MPRRDQRVMGTPAAGVVSALSPDAMSPSLCSCRMLEQVPARMAEAAVRWAKLVVPLVVHSASKVRLRAAAAMELGLPLLLQKQADVAAIVEPMMSTVSVFSFSLQFHSLFSLPCRVARQ